MSHSAACPADAAAATQRLDKWVWFARLVRTRAQAAALIRQGFVRINGRRITQPGHAVKTSDVLTLALPSGTRVVRILCLAERRGPAASTVGVYTDLTMRTHDDGGEPAEAQSLAV